jgi:hypothetical protein
MAGSDARQSLSPWRSWPLGGFLEDPKRRIFCLKRTLSREKL